MEDDLKSIFVSIAEDILEELQRFLLVTTEEVDFNGLHTQLLHPRHVTLSSYRIAHNVAGTLRCIVLRSIAVIPQHQTNSFALCIVCQRLYTLSTNLFVPKRINKYVLIAHCCSHINELFLVFIVTTFIHPKDPTPCIAPGFIVILCSIKRFNDVIRNGCFHDGLQRITNCYRAPWRATW